MMRTTIFLLLSLLVIADAGEYTFIIMTIIAITTIIILNTKVSRISNERVWDI